MLFILLHFLMEVLQFDARGLKHGLAFGAGVIFPLAHHALDAAVDDEHGADAAGCHAAVEGGTI